MDHNLIAMNLSDGTGCYGRRVEGEPHLWWLRRTTTTVYAMTDQVAPTWARQQAEQKLAAGQWEIGGVIQITQP